MSATYSIRPIRSEDWPELDRIQRAAFMADAVEDIATIQALWKLAPEICLVAESERLLGYLIAHPWLPDDLPPLNVFLPGLPQDATTLFIHDLALLPEARGRRIAQALLSEVLSLAQAQGLQNASLLSIQGSHPFWEKQGFRARPDLAGKVGPILNRFLVTDFVFMSRSDLCDGKISIVS